MRPDRWAVSAALLLSLPLLAGCLDDAEPQAVPQGQAIPHEGGVRLAQAGAEPAAADHLVVDRFGERIQVEGDCPCAPLSIALQVPAGAWDGKAGWLEARLAWDGTRTAGFRATLAGPNGTADHAVRGFDALRVVAWKPEAGAYNLRLNGTGHAQGWLELREKGARQVAGEDLLPNLQTLVPTDLAVRDCQPAETAEQGATRCLRLSNGVANTGDGPLEVRLSFPDGALSAGGLGHFQQRLYDASGSYRQVEVGPAQFHPVHGHFHYAGLAHFVVYAYDEATGLRGAEMKVGHKAGFCFLDWSPMHEPEFEPDYQGAHAEQDCEIPTAEAWSMGISPGWYDLYWSDLADQYVDVAGLPDGTYELVSVADAPQTLLETDETDNASSVVFTLQGDTVEVVEERGFYTRTDGDL
jgi:hypothetical protein